MAWGARRPCTIATVTGKKHRYIAITALGKTPVKPRLPSTTSTMGAMASTGTVCEATIQGMRARSSVTECTMPMASSAPSNAPSTNPSKVASAVTRA